MRDGTTAGRPGARLAAGRYVLESRLGGGGTADVFRGVDTRLGRPVAIKMFRPSADAIAERRFQDEARLLASLHHPGLVTVYDAGIEDGCGFLVLQLVEGGTVRTRLAHGPLLPEEVVEVGARLAGVLAYVHSRSIVHRDVKPSNVLLDHAGELYLADFGISRLLDATHHTATGMAVGTAAYMAPEQVQGHRVGEAADVYSLGLVLLECVTGEVEYAGGSVEAAVARLSRPPNIPTDLPAPLHWALTAMTSTDPNDRPPAQACAEVLGSASSVAAAEATAPLATSAEPAASRADADAEPSAPLDPTAKLDAAAVAALAATAKQDPVVEPGATAKQDPVAEPGGTAKQDPVGGQGGGQGGRLAAAVPVAGAGAASAAAAAAPAAAAPPGGKPPGLRRFRTALSGDRAKLAIGVAALVLTVLAAVLLASNLDSLNPSAPGSETTPTPTTADNNRSEPATKGSEKPNSPNPTATQDTGKPSTAPTQTKPAPGTSTGTTPPPTTAEPTPSNAGPSSPTLPSIDVSLPIPIKTKKPKPKPKPSKPNKPLLPQVSVGSVQHAVFTATLPGPRG